MPYGPIGVREHSLCQRSFSDGIDHGASQLRGHISQLQSQVETLAIQLTDAVKQKDQRIADLKSQLENSMQEVRQQRTQIRKWRESSFLENERRVLLTRAVNEVLDTLRSHEEQAMSDDMLVMKMDRAMLGLKITLRKFEEDEELERTQG